MSATPLLADVEDVASSAWEVVAAATVGREPWEVNMELPGDSPPIWKSFQSTPEFFDLKLLIRNGISNADTSMWEIFVDGERLTNENTVNMLKGKSAVRTDGQARRVVVTAQRLKPMKHTSRWPTWIVLSLSLLMFCSLAFAVWYEQAYEELLEEGFRQTSRTTANMNSTRHQAFEEGRSRQAASDAAKMNATRHQAFEEGRSRQAASDAAKINSTRHQAFEEGRSRQAASDAAKMNSTRHQAFEEVRSRQAASDAAKMNSTRHQAFEEGRSRQAASDAAKMNSTRHQAFKEGRSRQAASDAAKMSSSRHQAFDEGLKEGRSRQALREKERMNESNREALEEGIDEGRSRQASIDITKMNATKEQAFEEGVREGRSRQAASDTTELNATKRKAFDEGMKEGRASEAEMLRKIKKEAYEKGIKDGENNQSSSDARLPEKKRDEADDKGLKDIVSGNGLQKTHAKGSPEDRPSHHASKGVGDALWHALLTLWYVIEVIAALGSLLFCGVFFIVVAYAAVYEHYKGHFPWWFAVPAFIASVVALPALVVMLGCGISEPFLQVEQRHSFMISMAACLACSCLPALLMLIAHSESSSSVIVRPIAFAGAALGMLLFESVWISWAVDPDGQQLVTMASFALLAVSAWLGCWVFGLVEAWKKCSRAAVVHFVLCTLLVVCFFEVFSPSALNFEKDLKPALFTVVVILCLPLFGASVSMALINWRAAVGRRLTERALCLLIGSLFFAPMCAFTMLHLQDSRQRLATTILTMLVLLLSYAMRDWLKKPCW